LRRSLNSCIKADIISACEGSLIAAAIFLERDARKVGTGFSLKSRSKFLDFDSEQIIVIYALRHVEGAARFYNVALRLDHLHPDENTIRV